MSNRFEQMLSMETEFRELSRQRDELFEKDDAEVSGFQLANVLAAIRKVEDEMRALGLSPALVG